MRRAQDDLDFIAQYPTPTRHYPRLCFLARETTERALEAVVLHLGFEIPFVYDLGGLVDLIAEQVEVPPEVQQAAALEAYGEDSLYPPCPDPPSEEHWREALRLARVVVEWAETILEAGPQ